MTQRAAGKAKRAVVAAVHLAGVSDLEFDASLAELRQLAKTLGFEDVDAGRIVSNGGGIGRRERA